jgi:hypothetical protein
MLQTLRYIVIVLFASVGTTYAFQDPPHCEGVGTLLLTALLGMTSDRTFHGDDGDFMGWVWRRAAVVRPLVSEAKLDGLVMQQRRCRRCSLLLSSP